MWYIRHPSRGSLIGGVEPWMLGAGEGTLAVPDSTSASLHVHVKVVEIDRAREPVCDRWLGYHLSMSGRVLCELELVGGKLASEEGASGEAWVVMSGSEMTTVMTPIAGEAALRKRANADRDRLRRVCESAMGCELPGAIVVGVDLLGLDVRTSVGPVRMDVEATPGPRFVNEDGTIVEARTGAEMVEAMVGR